MSGPSGGAAAPITELTQLLPDSFAVTTDGRATIGGVALDELAERFGTPLFVYDEDHLRRRCQEAARAFPDGGAYATKAFLCRAMARIAHDEGLMLDVATGGEMHVALAADVPPERLVLHGNNKSPSELSAALEVGVGRIVVDNFDEMARIERLVDDGAAPPNVLIRVNPGVEVHTNEKVATGVEDSKFGFSVAAGAAAQAVERARNSAAMRWRGVHFHIGSQVFSAQNFGDALGVVGQFIRALEPEELVVGGGLGVPYVAGEAAPSITEWAEQIHRVCARAGIGARIGAEPGRAVVAQAAVTLYRVGAIKEVVGPQGEPIRTYVAVDGGMSDNPRPVLYGSGYETFMPAAADSPRDRTVTVVGKHCESGDRLVVDGQVPQRLAVGDLIATPVTGAYGHSMGSNYNRVVRPAVVFVRDGDARIVVRRETHDDLMACDVG